MSPSGALLEGSPIPEAGSLVQLVRGGLIVHALVAWTDDGRFGLKFSGFVDVQQWRAVPANGEQQRVDEIVRLVKAGAVPLPVTPRASSEEASEAAGTDAQLARDLGRAADLLDCLGDLLASDPDIVAHHGAELQKLDIASQMIAAVRGVIGGESDLQIDATKFIGLRRSAEQALKHIA